MFNLCGRFSPYTLIVPFTTYLDGTSSSGKMASYGHSGTHAPQSMQVSGSIKYHGHLSSGLPATMHSTGQTSTHAPSRRHRLVMMWVIPVASWGQYILCGTRRFSHGPCPSEPPHPPS